MMRPIALAGVLALAALPAAAQPPVPPPTRLTLDPTAAPVPALKYRLLPDVRQRQRGNALVPYYRAYSPEWQSHRRNPKYMERVAAANEKPLRDLTLAEVTELAGGFSSAMLKEVDRGARRTYCDWEMTQRLRDEGIGLLLPDLQGFRQVASLLKVRARQELLAGRYDQAARTLQTGLALGRHLCEGPTLIHSLVGAACTSLMLQVIDDWVDRPGAPNLYWALTDLPRPLISMRNGLEGERLTIDWLLPGYRELLDDPTAAPEASGTARALQNYAGLAELAEPNRTLGPLLFALKSYPRARRFLRDGGRSAAEVEAMPALQVVFLYEAHFYDVVYDDMLKWASLPYPEAAPHFRQATQRSRKASRVLPYGSLAGLLLPAVEKVFAVPVRIDRKVAALRCVEALRLHAAAHGGKLPAKLDDVTVVPIPLDTMTGKAFDYRLEGNTATLTGPTPPGETANATTTLRYELTLRTAKGK